ncbi:MAG: AraC family ligand binding domain-containing protein, partial [Solobacterium sp.]|nr:AraC family ligand binding domain-containing protein [Solobacterium sp.]
MEFATNYYETSEYRCLVHQEKQTNDLFLLLCGAQRCIPGYEFHTNGRSGYHLHVILDGRGILCVNGKESVLKKGQLFITKPEEDTWYRADEHEPWSYCWMTFDGDLAERYCHQAGFEDQVNALPCNVNLSEFYLLVKKILDRPEMAVSNELLRLGVLLEFLALAIESNDKATSGTQKTRELSADAYVEYAVTYILGNYATAKISDLARYIGINRSYLTHLFKEKKGVSPQEYLMQCRIER